ncbi:MAG: DUF4037 domain-containing protein [Oscillospiraceae bacterium]|nr:DUF4037 domain-containing protein [Oscillospiraceae bacterium]
MSDFIQGLPLCEGFFFDEAKPLLDRYFPELPYTAGLIGYGSDVLGYADAVSAAHMWGPRFYMFLSKEDISIKDEIFQALCSWLPYTYEGYSVNFTEPNPNDNGVQKPKLISTGKVNPLVFIQTFEDFLTEELGTADLDNIKPYEWLSFSEHRLLSLVSGKFFIDGLNCAEKISKIRFYPKDVKLYLIASNWEIIASEQAFVKRCGECGDDIGSKIICSRICERLMRLCFLYKEAYAPYSKWFGTAFGKLDVDDKIKQAISGALSAESLSQREKKLAEAQAFTAEMHNASGLTEPIDYKIESYFGRDIKVIFAEKFSCAVSKELIGTAFENVPLLGTLSQVGGVASITDDMDFRRIADFNRGLFNV